MNESANIAGPRFRLDAGMSVLEQWSETAVQSQRNSVYKALFRIIDGSVFRESIVLGDVARSDVFSVVVKEDLIIRFSLLGLDTFAIHYIGRPVGAPAGIDANATQAH